MNHEEAQELLAVYSLNAVDEPERGELERHVDECVRCSSELDGLRTVATSMGNVGEPASQELWQRISERLYDDAGADATPPIRVLELAGAQITSLSTHRSKTPTRAKFGAGAFAVAAAALLSVLSVNLVHADNQVNQLNAALGNNQSVVESMLQAPGHVTVTLNGGHSVALAKFVLLNGSGYMFQSNMTPLPANETYQLWGIINGKAISIGIMGPKPGRVSFTVAGSRRPTELAVSVEPAGGSTVPTTPLVASGIVTA